ncbi:lysocardiolipin acyltransferase 1-like [Hyposmocoma kahamanoa]|uniref:lysocardiolipin acyltransferase 1-like n=1 Tax=Hyposmocoma kahamanoa TaxID=1477025 RepID=UPI000E6D9855|nr:lysocardiolipin acyltransferase 1-like [Hyposmocoma kahamanoa]
MAAGFLLCVAWYFTILAGFYILYCPVIYLMFLNYKLYRTIVDSLFALWELYPVALFQCCFNTHLHHSGDYVDPDESTIIIINHRTRVDWNYVWMALYHATQQPEKCICKEKVNGKQHRTERGLLDVGGKSKTKFVLKEEIKNIPGMGWIMQLNYCLYVKRAWQEDQLGLFQFVDYYSRMRYPCRIVLFPEGTDLSEDNRRKSHKFAAVNNLPKYEFVLHPRTKGWAALCSSLRSNLTSIYDVTVAYDTPAQTEADLLRNKIPKHVYFHFKRYSIDNLPLEEEHLKTWLNERWSEKEVNLKKFHTDGNFTDLSSNKSCADREPRALHAAKLAFIFWTLVDILFMYLLIYSAVFQFWVIYNCLLFVSVTWYLGGFHNIQYKLLQKNKTKH